MKHNRILAAAASTLAVGLLSACGHTSTPSAQSIPPDKNCTEVVRPADPHNLIGREWPWMSACSALSDVQPGVDKNRAEAIVFDARQHVVGAKMAISEMATDGNKEADPDAQAKYRSYIENLRGNLANDLMDSRLALGGTPPAGFRLDYTKHHDPSKTCSDAWDFKACVATGGADKGQPPSYLTHSASPGLTEGQGR